MKKLIAILSCVFIFASCSNDKETEEYQDYTSFVFFQQEDVNLPNCIAGYFDSEGYCWQIATLGDLSKGIYSPEIIVLNEDITSVYFFTDYF